MALVILALVSSLTKPKEAKGWNLSWLWTVFGWGLGLFLIFGSFPFFMSWRESQPHPYVNVDLLSGNPQVVPMGVTSIAVVKLPMPRPNTGEVIWTCPSIVSPQLSMKMQFDMVAGRGTMVHQFALTKESKSALVADNIPIVKVMFTPKVAISGMPSPCR